MRCLSDKFWIRKEGLSLQIVVFVRTDICLVQEEIVGSPSRDLRCLASDRSLLRLYIALMRPYIPWICSDISSQVLSSSFYNDAFCNGRTLWPIIWILRSSKPIFISKNDLFRMQRLQWLNAFMRQFAPGVLWLAYTSFAFFTNFRTYWDRTRVTS